MVRLFYIKFIALAAKNAFIIEESIYAYAQMLSLRKS